MADFQQIGTDIGAVVEAKNQAYGSSVATVGEAMRLLYPAGIAPAQMDDALLLTRIWDKMMRIATDRDAFGESPFQDIAGYGILGTHAHQQRTKGPEAPCDVASTAGHPSVDEITGSAAKPAPTQTKPNTCGACAQPNVPASAPLSAPTAESPSFVVGDALKAALEKPRYTRITRPDMSSRNAQKLCAGCSTRLDHTRGPRVRREAHSEFFIFCSQSCFDAIWEPR